MVEGVFPVIRAGEFEDLSMICNEIGISNHQEEGSEWVKAKINNNSIDWKKLDTRKSIVPDVRGMGIRDALYVLENLGLQVSVHGLGKVKRQTILPGTRIDGQEIDLYLN